MKMDILIDTKEQLFPQMWEDFRANHPVMAAQFNPPIYQELKNGDVWIIRDQLSFIVIENKMGSDLYDIPRMKSELRRMAAFRERCNNKAMGGRDVLVPKLVLLCSDTHRTRIDRKHFKIAASQCQKFNIWFHHRENADEHCKKIYHLTKDEKTINLAQNLTYKKDHESTIGYGIAAAMDGLSPELGYKLAEGCKSFADVVNKFPTLKPLAKIVDEHFHRQGDVFPEEVMKILNYDLWKETEAIVCAVCGKVIESEDYKRHGDHDWECYECSRVVV